MMPELEGRIVVYRANDKKNVRINMLTVDVDLEATEKNTYTITPTDGGGVYMDVEIFDPVVKHIEHLEGENARLEARVQTLEDALEQIGCTGF